ncbi:uncharacterized protein BJ212DRAFT_1480076 [Suillus subaureus]|uniref:DUF4100 domain-containing protein n=1 Tax=Suillus subaureus TaxID=48587 RepID=A0A9P7JED0_9AGAM|nr:uncharacterized protein BJ212DRAFT_1480076 [Suillus subaureus]KAG1817507.1 hypothetical protein BJ212DRAFT_1480076 [Suillus subaureus]
MPNPCAPASPVMPSPKDSTKGESSDKFEVHDNPRNLPPGAFINTPKRLAMTSASTISSLSALTALSSLSNELTTHSEDAPVMSSSTLQKTCPTLEALPIKQEAFETPRTPDSIPGSIVLANISCKHEPQLLKPNPIINTTQQVTMATTYKMPIHGTNKAPKFDGTMENLVDFIDIYEGHADEVGLLRLDHIKGIIHYLPSNERELWGGLPEATLSDYEAFIKEIKAVTRGQVAKPMSSAKELSDYLHAFRRIMQPLINEDCIGKSKQDRVFIQGIPSDVQAQIHTCLQITTHGTRTPTCKSSKLDTLPNTSVTAGIFYHASPDVEVALDVGLSVFVHTIAESEPEMDKDNQEVMHATTKCDQRRSTRNEAKALETEEIVSPAVQASMGKGKAPEGVKATSAASTSMSKPKETAKAPAIAASLGSPPANTNSSSSSSSQYRFSFVLEDKDAEKRVIECLLDGNITIPVCKLFAVSPDIRKQFQELTTTKHVTISTVSVNELSSQPMTEEFIHAFEQD